MKLIKQALFLTRNLCRCYTSEAAVTQAAAVLRQNEIFDREKKRQLALVKRIEKIEVNFVGPSDACKLVMNKDLSTPYNVAMHFNQSYLQRSAVAMVNGKPWHMLQPLTGDCELQFATLKDDDVSVANEAFWRSCSHMMGAILQSAFRDDVRLEHARAPDIPVSAGCFAYDLNLPFKWEPTREEMTCLNRQAFSLAESKVNFERLEVSREVAQQLFEDNAYKLHQMEAVGSDRLVLFRLGSFVDISDGPMVTNTGFMQPYRFVFTCVHSFGDYLRPGNKLQRFQGVALPSEFKVHHTTWSLLEERAAKPVSLDMAPSLKSRPNNDRTEDETAS